MGRAWSLWLWADRGWPAMKSPSRTRKLMSSTRPRQKVSRLAAAGKRSSREISTAAVFSGLITMSMPRESFRRASSWAYSTLRTRAMVYRAPSRLAARQQTMLISSILVAAITTSALPASASRRADRDAPLPLTHRTSRASEARRRASSLVSMTVTSCSSWERCSARAKPTLPSPTMMIFKPVSFLSNNPNSIQHTRCKAHLSANCTDMQERNEILFH